MNGNRGKFVQSIILIILFCVLITSQFWLTVFRLEDIPKNEKRDLAVFPAFQWDETLLDFPTSFETYYLDHFAMRYRLIRLSRQVRYHVFAERFFPMVWIGDEGNLYLNTSREKNICQKSSSWTNSELSAFTESLNSAQYIFLSHGIEMYIGFIPDKCSLLPEFSENYLPILGEQSISEQLFDHLSVTTTIPLIDLSDSLLEYHERGEKIFYELDTHWTSIGSYAAYTQIITALNPEMSPNDVIQWDYHKDMNMIEGSSDLELLLNIPAFSTEEQMWPDLVFSPYTETDHGMIVYEKPDAEIDKTLLVFHDSFMNFSPIRPFLADHYQKAIFLSINNYFFWSTNQDELQSLIEEWHPDIVLVLYVERNIPDLIYDGAIYSP